MEEDIFLLVLFLNAVFGVRYTWLTFPRLCELSGKGGDYFLLHIDETGKGDETGAYTKPCSSLDSHYDAEE